MIFNPRNILIINFGQIGDVVLGLPALKAVRAKFPEARITAMIGKSGAEIIEVSGFADEKIIVDRVKLRDGQKFSSIKEVLQIVRDVRRRKFDFVIDLHSLYETNLLGFLSGANYRLYANRENRSLDFLAKFEPKPPREDKKLHLTDHYLNVLKPLGIENAPRSVEIQPRPKDLEKVENLFKAHQSQRLVGLFPGAGNASRRWNLEKFAELARNLSLDENLRTIVFLGPEEAGLRAEIEAKFPPETLIVDKLSLLEFVAALSKLSVLVSNDTSAIHLAAMVGTVIVLIMDKRAPTTYLPLAEKIKLVNNHSIDEIKTFDVLQAAREMLENRGC
ncbi:MAG: glycosyltransferase family 9 protein [Pyrinomonadaceae bacterium]|nr:glycosyltransferase family 9 protein [Pyrinomonadaceae bacterium]